MQALLHEYLPIFIFIGIAFGMACAALLASYTLARLKPDPAKVSPYAGGLEAVVCACGQF